MNIIPLTREYARNFLPPRDELCDKTGFGRLLAFCGSKNMPGAAVLSCRAAYRSGAGLVRLAAPPSVCAAVCAKTPECVLLPLPSAEAGCVLYEAAAPHLAQKALSQYSAVLFGCGVGTSENAARILYALAESCRTPLVIDADGLNLLTLHPDILENASCPLILTPHKRELARLLRAFSCADAARLSEKLGAVVVEKGAATVIHGEGACILDAPNSALAKGGSGDVLAGIIASLACQGASARGAACCGVWLHSETGRLARRAHTAYSALPWDCAEMLGAAFAQLLKA